MITNRVTKTGAMLLAAGGSSRMGRPKQLLEYKGETLVHRAAETLVRSSFQPIVAVLGAHAAEIKDAIADLALTVVFNDDWKTGMSSSIRVGLAELVKLEPEMEAVLIMLCDQPLITPEMIDRMAAEFETSRPLIVASEYNGIEGVPALFSREMFDELSELQGDKGARGLIRASSNVLKLTMQEAALDIDSVEDADSLN